MKQVLIAQFRKGRRPVFLGSDFTGRIPCRSGCWVTMGSFRCYCAHRLDPIAWITGAVVTLDCDRRSFLEGIQ